MIFLKVLGVLKKRSLSRGMEKSITKEKSHIPPKIQFYHNIEHFLTTRKLNKNLKIF
jgi:hypothetical protein